MRLELTFEPQGAKEHNKAKLLKPTLGKIPQEVRDIIGTFLEVAISILLLSIIINLKYKSIQQEVTGKV